MNGFSESLVASGPHMSGRRGDLQLDCFGRLVGSWHVRNRQRGNPDAPWRESDRTWIFAWILEGRGVQDVIVADENGTPVTGGTTIRCFDPRIDAWRVGWYGARHANDVSLRAQPHGDNGIWQDGVEHTPEGDVPVRWNFSDITPNSFAWDGWSTPDGGATWWCEQHMDATRIGEGDDSGPHVAAIGG